MSALTQEAIELIKALQWASCDGCGAFLCCPFCAAPSIQNVYDIHGNSRPRDGVHASTCPVGKFLVKAKHAVGRL